MSNASDQLHERQIYHPKFDSEEGDVVLRSDEGTLYRVPSFVLRTTCGFFEAMPSEPTLRLSTPVPNGITSPHNLKPSQNVTQISPIPTSQPDKTLSVLLLMISGLEIPVWSSIEDVATLLELCEAWDAPGPISIIRSCITSPFFLSDPLKVYAIATHFGWDEEAKIASTHTLKLNLHEEHYEKTLSSLSVGALLRLLRLHRSRRDRFKEFLDDINLFNAGNAGNPSIGELPACTNCGEVIDHHEWREFKCRVFWEMDRCASGEVIGSVEMEDWPETVACWGAKCRNVECGKLYYNKVQTIKKLRECMTCLPTTV